MIFQIFKIRKMMREGTENPANFAAGQAGEFLVSLFIIPFIISIVILVLLFILSFTTIIGGPFGIAKFFFFVVLFGTLAFGLLLWKLSKIAKHITRKTVQDTIEVSSKVIE